LKEFHQDFLLPELIALGEGTTAIESGVFVTGVRVDGLSEENKLTALIGLLSSSKNQKQAFTIPTKNRHSYFHSSSRSFNSRFVNRQERGLPTYFLRRTDRRALLPWLAYLEWKTEALMH
jgi:hypothetical protein